MDFTDTFKDNEAMHQYELLTDGKSSWIEYIKTDSEIYLTHTEMANELALENK